MKILSVLFLALNLIQISEKQIEVNGREAPILALSSGFIGEKGGTFDVKLENKLDVPTSIHWHGLILPNGQDGVAFVTQFPIYPSNHYLYQFPLKQAGTFWMHSHFGLQEQRLLSAPLILHGDGIKSDQEVVIMLEDFSFTSPQDIFQNLKCPKDKMKMDKGEDIADVKYDAFLANQKTLESPEIIQVKVGETIRLRIINASSGTNYFLSLGELQGEAIAVDGNLIKPFSDREFVLAAAQRIDILVKVPSVGSYPILAQGEGTSMQSGIVLATDVSKVPTLSSKAKTMKGRITNAQELRLTSLEKFPDKKVDNQINVDLGGNMEKYIWTINNQSWPESTPLIVEKGQRVEIKFKNTTSMSHPMHFHGHVFKVTEVDGQTIDGALRDTILVSPNSTASIQFDADNPGVWPFHCHLLYHLEAGMMTVVRYKDFIQPLD